MTMSSMISSRKTHQHFLDQENATESQNIIISSHRKCPVCHSHLEFCLKKDVISQIKHFPFPHLILHGDPLHAIVLYIDRNLTVRGWESVESLEIK